MKKIALVLSLSLGGCIATVPVTKQFDAELHKPYEATGNASITGQAFLKQNGGSVVTCAGEDVFLIPDTEYFKEFISIIKLRKKPGAEGKNFKQYSRVTTCDAQGNFSFENLPNQAWIVLTQVKWRVSRLSEGGILSTEVDLTNTLKGKAIMSKSILNY